MVTLDKILSVSRDLSIHLDFISRGIYIDVVTLFVCVGVFVVVWGRLPRRPFVWSRSFLPRGTRIHIHVPCIGFWVLDMRVFVFMGGCVRLKRVCFHPSFSNICLFHSPFSLAILLLTGLQLIIVYPSPRRFLTHC